MSFTWSYKPKNQGQITLNTVQELRNNLDYIHNIYYCSSANGTVTCPVTADCYATKGGCNGTCGSHYTTDKSNYKDKADYTPNDGDNSDKSNLTGSGCDGNYYDL